MIKKRLAGIGFLALGLVDAGSWYSQKNLRQRYSLPAETASKTRHNGIVTRYDGKVYPL